MSKKKTKKMMYEQILAHTTDKEEREFLESEITLLDKKATNKKPTKEQEQHALLKSEILEFIAVTPHTASEVWRSKEAWVAEWSVQKFSALLNQLENDGLVKRSIIKRIPYFVAVAPVEVEDEDITEVEGE